MKFLVLSYNTGLCHNSADLAINDMFISLGHECEIMDASEYVSNHITIHRKHLVQATVWVSRSPTMHRVLSA